MASLLDGTAHQGSDTLRNLINWLVLPCAKNAPTCGGEPRVRVDIARTIGLDLCPPEFSVCLGPGRMHRAAMPEATVDEDDHARTDEHNVSATPYFSEDAMIDAKAQAALVQERSKRQLRSRVSAATRLHAPPCFVRGCGDRRASSCTWPRFRPRLGLRRLHGVVIPNARNTAVRIISGGTIPTRPHATSVKPPAGATTPVGATTSPSTVLAMRHVSSA